MPKISVLTPLYNTEPDQLKEMIEPEFPVEC